jgi:hypothetical protein
MILIEGDGSGLDQVNVTGIDSFNIAGPSIIFLAADLSTPRGEYVIIDYSGQPLSDNWVTSNLYVQFQGALSGRIVHDAANTQVKLQLMYWQAWPQWYPSTDGTWGETENWEDFRVPNGPQDAAFFWEKSSQSITVTLDGHRQIGHLEFNSLRTTYTIANGSLGSLSVGSAVWDGRISAIRGSHRVTAELKLLGDTHFEIAPSAVLALSGETSIAGGKVVTKEGIGVLTIDGPQDHEAGSVLGVVRGRLNLNSNAGANGARLALSVTRNSDGQDATIVLGADQDLKELFIDFEAPGNQGFDLNSPPAAGGVHEVRVYADDLEGTLRMLNAAIRRTNQEGAISEVDGIFDSGLHPNSAIGLALRGDHVLLRSTRFGDLNLDGRVTISDFIELAANFGTMETATWQEGDLNHDGDITIADFIDLASNFNSSYSGGSWEIGQEDAAMLAAFAAQHEVQVPEPIELMLLPVAAGMLRRRRRLV